MKIEKAIKILELHNKWRRDNGGKYKMAEPKELGIAIDTIVREFKNLKLQNVGKRSKLLFAFEKYWNDNNCDGETFSDVVCKFLANFELSTHF